MELIEGDVRILAIAILLLSGLACNESPPPTPALEVTPFPTFTPEPTWTPKPTYAPRSTTSAGRSDPYYSIPSADNPNIEAAAKSACPHFYNILADLQLGLLTEYELREKFGEVYDSFVLLRADGDASSQAAYDVAVALYASVTPPLDADETMTAVRSMDRLCDRYG